MKTKVTSAKVQQQINGSGKEKLKKQLAKHDAYNELSKWKGTPEFNSRMHGKKNESYYYYSDEDSKWLEEESL